MDKVLDKLEEEVVVDGVGGGVVSEVQHLEAPEGDAGAPVADGSGGDAVEEDQVRFHQPAVLQSLQKNKLYIKHIWAQIISILTSSSKARKSGFLFSTSRQNLRPPPRRLLDRLSTLSLGRLSKILPSAASGLSPPPPPPLSPPPPPSLT